MLPRVRLVFLLSCTLVLSAALAPPALALTVFDLDNQSLGAASGVNTQTGRLTMSGGASTCGAQKPTPSSFDSAPHKVRTYQINNGTTSTQCITFTIDPKACIGGNNSLFAAAHQPFWSPSSPATNYAGDIGSIPGAPASFAVDVPAGGSVWLVVGSADPAENCTNFRATATSPRPIANSAPTLPGAAYVGASLTTTNGSWAGGAMTFSYSWQRCDAAGANCAFVGGAAAATYVPTSADVGRTFRTLVTATAGGQSSSALSGQSNIVPATPPIAAIELVRSSGATLAPAASLVAGSQGIDDAMVTVALPFQIELGGKLRDIVNASSNGVLEWDADKAFDPASYTNVPLPARDLAGAIAPYWDDLDTSGADDGLYTETRGAAPNRTFVVEWRARLHSTATVVNFALLLHEGSPVVDAVYGRMDVTGEGATIGYQAAPAVRHAVTLGSDAAGLVGQGTGLAFAPLRGSVDGTPQRGSTLTGTAGSLVGQLPIATSTQWLRCDAAGGGCSPVGGATGPAYPLGDADVGHTLRLRTAATNADGSGQVDSPATAVVTTPAAPPAGAPPSGGPAPDKLAPALSRLALKSTRLRRGAAAALTLTLSEPARLTIAVQRLTSGHRSGRRCVAGAPKRVHGKRQTACTFARTVATRTANAKAGRQTIKVLLGRLSVGRYRLQVSAADAAGNRTAKTASLAFRVRR